MKNRFNTIDTIAIVIELKKLEGSRVNQIYDVDNKTYLIKLNAPDSSKQTLLFESGIRIHTTKCDWPKNPTPSGFTMKLRKHIRNKRMVKIEQLGYDRIIDIQFGSDEAAYHIMLEFFHKGNIVLTDHEYNIVSLLRVYSDNENHHFAVREKYPVDRARPRKNLELDDVKQLLISAKTNEQIKKTLLSSIDFGSSFLEHCLRKSGINPEAKVKSEKLEELNDKLATLVGELNSADAFIEEMKTSGPQGFIFSNKKLSEGGQELMVMVEFNPYLFLQGTNYEITKFDTFADAVDEFFSKIESQKLELSVLEKENEAMRKVNKIRADQESRLQELSQKQLLDKRKADIIMNNADVIEQALKIIRYTIAAQMSWGSIKDYIYQAKQKNDPIACLISKTKFEVNQISMVLSDPFADSDDENKPVEVDIDLSLSAHANATRYYDHKKHAAIKEKKTLESQRKALKSAEKKAREILKTVKTQAAITVSRKVYWFEKFFWFISSDNYLVIGGRDQKQNELIVKRYMKKGDLYVHADLVGASSIVIKNPTGAPVPPRTLDEAGHMAVCYSNAWDTQIICRAWWVFEDQVSKTAPSGEYLVTGSFMIRGQKNYLLPTHLQLGFSFLFKVEESSAFRHVDERRSKWTDSNEAKFSHLSAKDPNPGQDDIAETDVTTELEELHLDCEADSGEDSPDSPSSGPSNVHDSALFEEERYAYLGTSDTGSSVDKVGSDLSTIQEINTEGSILSKDSTLLKCDSEPSNEKSELPCDYDDTEKEESDEENLNNKPVHKTQKLKKIQSTSTDNKAEASVSKAAKLKRGQKSKLKKIKEKYKDQDEEEKQLRMSILQSAGTPKKVDKKSKTSQPDNKNKKGQQPRQKKDKPTASKEAGPNLDDLDTEQLTGAEREVQTELDMLNLLTGQPHPEDELLYALPIIAPYSSVLNNKFKIKIVPGTSKRGKAARVALEHFLRLKECTSVEKDLMKCVPDQDLYRNFPGKIKLLATQLKKK